MCIQVAIFEETASLYFKEVLQFFLFCPKYSTLFCETLGTCIILLKKKELHTVKSQVGLSH